MQAKTLMVIDGSSLVHRAFYALPLLSNKSGVYTNGVYGFLTMLYKVLDHYKPDYICVAFDRKGKTFRHEAYESYKGTRDKTPNELSMQFPILKEILKNMGIKTIDLDMYEADDIAGTLAEKAEDKGLNVYLVTGDRDYLQLATDKIKIIMTKKGITEIEEYDRKRINEEYGIEPKQFIEVKALMGDKSDNIPGIDGIGEKTALKLVQQYGSIENVFNNINEIKGKLREKLSEGKNIAIVSRRLSEIITQVPLDFEIEDLTFGKQNTTELKNLFEDLEFKSLLNKLDSGFEETKPIEIFQINEIKNDNEFNYLINRINEAKEITFKFVVDDYLHDNVIGLGIKVKGENASYIDFTTIESERAKALKDIFNNKDIIKNSWDCKSDIVSMFKKGWDIFGLEFDSAIAQYLINPDQIDYAIDKIAKEYLEINGNNIDDLLGKGKSKKNFKEIEKKEIMEYIAFALNTVELSKPKMMEIIEQRQMEELFLNVEIPLVEVLASMEYFGILVNEKELEDIGKSFDVEVDNLINDIYQLAGEEFNINSPKQLGYILFEKLKLPTIKKIKTGYSTDIEVLEELKDVHPIAEKLIRYRQIIKLKSTYIEGLKQMINKNTGRINSKFNQTVTSTGRISSTEPNLQNIPIRSEDGKKIRRAFVAQQPDYIFLDADYSQIELRILAHLSDDEKMIEAFINDEDIHIKTASEIFGVELSDVTPELRAKAKTINFSIIYGISDYSLSKDLEISRKEARKYIDEYFENYSGVKRYMENSISKAKEQGYVETILNRRRYIPDINSNNYNIRSFGERVAMNMPIQGSAADIIKMAMVEIYKDLKQKNLKSHLVLTIHDELIIETYIKEKEYIKSLMKEKMENVVKLKVPLKVEIAEGVSWYDTK
ncbi:DNA polymerase I [Soehngenia longivitae]|uniref:DNA polymerase I n=1 Tax=Soehngenia longivitae TaxID=2562294 RepID=A0A4Z0D5K6_9FIRM|nr:DNA polymerase I [Soehngenia longivitae]TFZ40002.1 DNA polymerase I [Soehngenia longivitae]